VLSLPTMAKPLHGCLASWERGHPGLTAQRDLASSIPLQTESAFSWALLMHNST